jgi:hypothetical protein
MLHLNMVSYHESVSAAVQSKTASAPIVHLRSIDTRNLGEQLTTEKIFQVIISQVTPDADKSKTLTSSALPAACSSYVYMGGQNLKPIILYRAASLATSF